MHTADLEHGLRRILDTVPGRAALVVRSRQWSFAYRAGDRMPAASIIKLPILLEVFRAHRAGELDLAQDRPVPPAGRVGGMGVLTRMPSVKSLSLRDLATLMIIVSDNTATNLVIDAVGSERVNALARSLGLTGTVLQRKMMDFAARARGLDNYTTAGDTAEVLQAIWDGRLTGPEGSAEMLEILRNQQFNHKLPARFARVTPGDPVLAHKTGELPGTEHDAGVLETPSGPVVIVALTTDLVENVAGQEAIARIGALIHQWATA